MLLASYIKDMSIEELFEIVKPILYLLPLALVIALVVIIVKISKSFAVKRMLKVMERKGVSESDKRNYLANYLMRTSQKDLIEHNRNCPVCGKKYSLKVKGENTRGDKIEKWNHDGCTFCSTKVYLEPEVNYKRYFAIKRNATNSPKEKEWQEVFEKLEKYIDYYKPYIDCSPDISEDKITIDISLR